MSVFETGLNAQGTAQTAFGAYGEYGGAEAGNLANPYYGASTQAYQGSAAYSDPAGYPGAAYPSGYAEEPSGRNWMHWLLYLVLGLVLAALVMLVATRLWAMGSSAPAQLVSASLVPERIAPPGQSLEALESRGVATSSDLDRVENDDSLLALDAQPTGQISTPDPLPEVSLNPVNGAQVASAQNFSEGIQPPRSRPSRASGATASPSPFGGDTGESSGGQTASNPNAIAGQPTPISLTSTVASGGFRVQFASVTSSDNAFALRERINRNYLGLLGNQRAEVSRALVNGTTFYRVHALKLSNRSEANRVCNAFVAEGISCAVLAN